MAKILIIDDDMIVRDMLLQMMEMEGIDTVSAENGRIALKIIQDTSLDLIITDIVMPEKDGIETIIAIKKLKPQIPIIALSGGGKITPEVYLEMAQKLGARYSFTKPVDRKHLLMAVQNCLRSHEKKQSDQRVAQTPLPGDEDRTVL